MDNILKDLKKNPLLLPAQAILSRYRRGALSPVEMAERILSQARSHRDLNAFQFIDAAGVLKAAIRAERNYRTGYVRPAEGIFATVKDWYDVAGMPTRMGSKTTSAAPAAGDSLPVERLRHSGCIILGKTTLPEYGHKGVTDSPLAGSTRNPHDKTKTCGGSSGGAAVAAALGLGSFHLGSDAGGSIRIPASFCGVIGFKPSPGIVAQYPHGYFSSLSSAGPLARHVADAAWMTDILSAPDPRDVYHVPHPAGSFRRALARAPDMSRMKIAYMPAINGVPMMQDVATVMRRAIGDIGRVATVRKISPAVPDVTAVFNALWMAVASRIAADMTARDRRQCDPRFLHWAARGDVLSLHEYLDAQQARLDVTRAFMRIFDTVDILLMPATAMTAFAAGQNMPDAVPEKSDIAAPWDNWTPFTYPANLAGLPALSVPVGMTASGLPVGLQIVGKRLDDARVLQFARMLERAGVTQPSQAFF